MGDTSLTDPLLTELRERHHDLSEKLAGRREFRVPTDSFRRLAVEVGLRAVEDAIEKREAELDPAYSDPIGDDQERS